MVARLLLLICFATTTATSLFAQATDCAFKAPFFHLHFGKGYVQDVNTTSLSFYERVSTSCPSDGHYNFCSTTSDCFRGDWHTLIEDHTSGDVEGNMLLVNSAYDKGVVLNTGVKGFRSGTTYQLGLWLMNLCKPSWKCPSPLLPNLTIQLQTPAGKTIAQFVTGELLRNEVPLWTQYRGVFTMPASSTELTLTLINTSPGGCGNDFCFG